MKNLKSSFVIILIILLSAVEHSFALRRLREGMDFYMRDRYLSSQKKVNSYLADNPKDGLALDMLDMIDKTICSIYLKKAFSLISKELDSSAIGELEKASLCHSEYTNKIEKEFSLYLNEHPKEKAANRLIFKLLKSPEPSDQTIYEIGGRLRKRLADLNAKVRTEPPGLKRLRNKINKLKKKKRWNEMIELITEYLLNNPKDIDVKVMLTEINRLAAEDFYNQAVYYFEKAKIEYGKEKAELSKKYDSLWFDEKISSDIEEVKTYITMKKDEEAKASLKVLSHLDPENQETSLYLNLLEADETEFYDRSLELYETGKILEAAARFDLLRLREPGNDNAQLYYNLASARKFIKKLVLDKVKEHLIKALEISPDEKEAIEIFSRLQEILQILSKS